MANALRGSMDAAEYKHGVLRIFDAEFRPSEVLLQMELETYRVYLGEFAAEMTGTEISSNRGDDTGMTS